MFIKKFSWVFKNVQGKIITIYTFFYICIFKKEAVADITQFFEVNPTSNGYIPFWLSQWILYH